MNKKYLWLIVAVVVAGGAWFFLGGEKKKEIVEEPVVARPVKTVVLDTTMVEHDRVFPGAVRAAMRVDIAFRVSGQLIERPITRGQSVKKGDLLAKLDPRDFESQVKNARASLDGAVARLASMRTGRPEDIATLEAALASAQAKLTEASSNYRRITNLFEKQAVAKTQYDQAKATLDVSTANVNSARQELAKGKAGARPEDIAAQEASIQGLESQLKKAEDALADTQLVAPFDGLVAELFVDNFQSVAADQKIAVIHDLKHMEITIDMPGTLILDFQKHDTNVAIEAVFSNLPGRKFPLKFKEIATQANAQTQTYSTTFTLENTGDTVVLPGMVADVRLSFSAFTTETTGFIVPADAVIAGTGADQYVWKVVVSGEGGLVVKKMSVIVDGYTNDRVAVTGELAVGDRIVTAGVKYLLEGTPVTLYEAKP